MQVCTSLQTDIHATTPPLSFLQAGCPSCHPTNSIKALKANTKINREMSADLRLKRNNTDGVVGEPNSKKPGPLLAGRHSTKSHADDTCRHLLTLCVFIQLASLQRNHTHSQKTTISINNQPTPRDPFYYSHYTGQPVLAGTSS